MVVREGVVPLASLRPLHMIESDSKPCIEIRNVSKQFMVEQDPARTVAGFFVSLAQPHKRRPRRAFMAIDNISAEFRMGETVGIIGSNGSGKSTLLKLIAGIYAPTSGNIQVRRRMVPLLELGAGFHAELSGRENIYLNGALLGHSHSEMDRVYDEIVAFSGVESFINTPLKFYSSGMRVRLGFAVAIHLEAEVMLLDEIFAVGDEQFQDKCIRRLRHFQAEGRTLILVSHGLSLVKRLCDRALWIEHGKLIEEGTAVHVVDQYLLRSNENVGV